MRNKDCCAKCCGTAAKRKGVSGWRQLRQTQVTPPALLLARGNSIVQQSQAWGLQPLGTHAPPSNTCVQPHRLQFELHDTNALLGHIGGSCPLSIWDSPMRVSLTIPDPLCWHFPQREYLVDGRGRIQLCNDRRKFSAQQSCAPVYLD